jgi:hypothetical protein
MLLELRSFYHTQLSVIPCKSDDLLGATIMQKNMNIAVQDDI